MNTKPDARILSVLRDQLPNAAASQHPAERALCMALIDALLRTDDPRDSGVRLLADYAAEGVRAMTASERGPVELWALVAALHVVESRLAPDPVAAERLRSAARSACVNAAFVAGRSPAEISAQLQRDGE